MNCGPSARLEDDLPESRSEFADEGTFLHSLVEHCLINGEDVAQVCGVAPWEESKYFTKENQEAAQYCIDYARDAQRTVPGALTFYEQRLDFSHLVAEGFGTSDLILVGHRTLHCYDWKFGRGYRVDADGNPQGRLYLSGALNAFEELGPFEEVTFTVVQPKLDHVSTESLTVEELIAWGESIKPLAARAFAGDGDFTPGAWCKFCRAKAQCTARSELLEQAVIAKFPAPDTISIPDLASRLPYLELAEAWIKDVKAHLLKEAAAGVEIPGHKLVAGRTSRRYGDQSEATKALLSAGLDYNDITKPIELLGITDMTRLLGKKKFSELLDSHLVTSSGTPTLVPVSDKRPAIAASTLTFEDLS
jgi:hypothetical protein